MHIVLNGPVDSQMLEKLVNSFNNRKDGEEVVVYLYTSGGESGSAESIIAFINSYKQMIHLIGYTHIMSAGFNIFFKAECSKELMIDTIGMIHLSRVQMDITESGTPKEDYDKFYIKEMKRTKAKTLKFLSNLGLTEEELNTVAKDKDAYFSYPRLLELLNNQNASKKTK